MSGRWKKFLVVIAIAGLVAVFFAFDLQRYLTLTELKTRQEAFTQFYTANRLLTLGLYFGLYVLVTALSLPGAAVMTLAGGALFGFLPALVVVSFASTIGATLAFLVSRFLLRDWVQSRFRDRLAALNAGIEREGAFYLFTLRLVPIFPFFIINLVMGLTPMRAATFYWVSQVGMLAGTAVYVNAGTQLGQIESLGGILSPGLLLSFVLLGIFPLLARKGVDIMKKRQTLKEFLKPKAFDYNLVVLGAGSAGLVSSYIAAAVKAKVALIEKHKMGGDCLNTGCVPSKALIRSAKLLAYGRRAGEFGFRKTETEFDFGEVMERVQRVVGDVEPHDSVERYTALGVECIAGEARISSPYTVEVNGRTLTTRSIIIATGASPFVPPIPGLDQIDYLTSDTLWQLRELPRRLVVLGGGPIGCEMTQAFARFGAEVTQVGMLKALAEQDERPDLLVGSSMGAINAAYYAADPTAKGVAGLETIWRSLQREDIFRFSWPGGIRGLLGRRTHLFDEKTFEKFLVQRLPYQDFAEASIPIHIIASDFVSGEEEVLSQGKILPALQASAAIPGIFPPVEIAGRFLIDGGVANHTPVSTAIKLGASRLIVLPTGFTCAPIMPLGGALTIALHSLNLIIARQLRQDLENHKAQADIFIVPPFLPATHASSRLRRGGSLDR